MPGVYLGWWATYNKKSSCLCLMFTCKMLIPVLGVHGDQFDAENKEGNTSGDEKESEGKDLKESSNDSTGKVLALC